MHAVILIAVVVALTLAELSPALPGRGLVLPAVVAYLAGATALGALRTALSLRALAAQDGSLPKALRKHNLLTVLAHAWLIAGPGGLMLAGYGQWALQDLKLRYVPLLGEVVLLLPFIAALLVSWLLEYPFYRLMRARVAQQQAMAGGRARAAWSLGQYMGYNLRHHLLFVAAPVGLILLLTDSLRLLHEQFPHLVGEVAVVIGSMGCAAAVFLVAPVLIVRIWRTGRLPAGRLRDELLATARQTGLRFRALLVWRSGGMIANAGVMGLIARLRYVLLSDALLEHLDDREIKAIFAHEAGHIVHHHLAYAMIFALSTAVLSSTAAAAMVAPLHLDDWVGEAITLVVLGAVWGLGFGWISRRFERQSDAYGAWSSALEGPDPAGRITPEGAAIFCRALEQVAQLNGIPPHQRSWRHGSIASRVTYILWLGSTAGGRGPIDRTVRRIKGVLWAALALSAAAVAVRLALGV